MLLWLKECFYGAYNELEQEQTRLTCFDFGQAFLLNVLGKERGILFLDCLKCAVSK